MRKAFEAYRSFEEWVSVHKHSTPAIYSELETSLEAAEGDLPQGLKFYIIGLDAIRSEIDAEIFESGEWIEYFEKQKG